MYYRRPSSWIFATMETLQTLHYTQFYKTFLLIYQSLKQIWSLI